MKILLLHQNFPGQFLHLAPALAARGHDVRALTVEGNERPSPVPRLLYRKPQDLQGIPPLAATYAKMAERGRRVALAAAELRRVRGYVPDLVLGHSGWGETLFVKEVWPESKLIVYSELVYHSVGLDAGFDPEFQRDTLDARMLVTARAGYLIQALAQADAALSPTAWQASTVPESLRGKIKIIHDGIDTDRVRPDPQAQFELPNGRMIAQGDEVLTFVSRNLEPYRGFHIFMRALPRVMRSRPNVQVVIVGGEGVSYGAPPGAGRSWKDVLLAELSDDLDLSRVHFVGQIPYARYLSLLQVTRAHAYLTYPFVLSWSLLEAMAAAVPIVASNTGPVREALWNGVTGRLVEFFDVDGWSRSLIEALSEPEKGRVMGRAARQFVLANYDLKQICLPAQIQFIERQIKGGADAGPTDQGVLNRSFVQ
jgi:glycosyltransferase involved in cell wall biosynthesis